LENISYQSLNQTKVASNAKSKAYDNLKSYRHTFCASVLSVLR